jgi:hypothetical protein
MDLGTLMILLTDSEFSGAVDVVFSNLVSPAMLRKPSTKRYRLLPEVEVPPIERCA